MPSAVPSKLVMLQGGVPAKAEEQQWPKHYLEVCKYLLL